MNKVTITFSIIFSIFIGFSACKKDYIDYAKLQQEEIESREHYLADNYTTIELTEDDETFTALLIGEDTIRPTSSGLYYIETLEGDGIMPTTGRMVTTKYVGKLLDGTEFDSNDWFQHVHGTATAGWTEGVGMMKKGGKATLIVPSGLAYGQYENGDIPRYSTLVFDIELLNAQK